jgi:hypothetical protein
MNVFTRLAFASLFFALSQGIAAQNVTLAMPFLNNAQPTQNINLPVGVTGFTNVVSMQYVIKWDPTVLQFLTIDNFNLPLLSQGSFNTTAALDSGIVRVQYEATGNFDGVSVANGTNIFRMRYKVIGAVNSSTPVCFIEKYPTSMEITRVENGVTVAYDENTIGQTCGFVAVGFTVDSNEPSSATDMAARIFPNPFVETTKVEFEQPEAGEVSIAVTDVTGNVVFQEKNWWAAGRNATVLEKSDFPAKGTYFLTIKTASHQCVRPLFLF